MKILVDTSIWSLALRRNKPHHPHAEINELQELIREVRVQMIGPIRQELLSGIKEKTTFLKLKKILAAFPDLPLDSEDFVLAADYFNILRRQGIQGSNTDFLICAISTRHHLPIFTNDHDFRHYQKHIPIILHKPRTTKE